MVMAIAIGIGEQIDLGIVILVYIKLTNDLLRTSFGWEQHSLYITRGLSACSRLLSITRIKTHIPFFSHRLTIEVNALCCGQMGAVSMLAHQLDP